MKDKLSQILKVANVPDEIIKELENEPAQYREEFLEAIEVILQNEVLNLMAFMQVRRTLKKKFTANK